jgi:hypothetical protein
MSDTDPLLAAVEALTKPVIDHVAQKTDAGKWIRAHTVEHEPLLTQMHDKVWPSSGNDANSKAAPQERSLADNTALFEYAKICSAIADWVRMAGGKAGRLPIDNLEQWARLHMADLDRDDDWYIRALHGWAYAIRKFLDKPTAFTLTGACPVCHATEWGNMIDGGGMRVLRVEYVLDENERIRDMNALCQACRIVWEGRDAVEELADELNEKDKVEA